MTGQLDSCESFFIFAVEPDKLLSSSMQLYLGRYRVVRPGSYENLWLEATGTSLYLLLDNKLLTPECVQRLAFETLKYSCRLRGYRSPWLDLSPEELLSRVIESHRPHFGRPLPESQLLQVAKCRYRPPPEILQALPHYRPAGRLDQPRQSPRKGGRRDSTEALRRPLLSSGSHKPSPYTVFRYMQLLRQRAGKTA
mmetsp:Transcript_14254/g.33739  ORF Transcript_14254/g.33739 Transcript_14254/m.33739 type:complete len:196 (+) Transcript_14254:480-1067(+)